MSDRDGYGRVRTVISFVHTLHLDPLRREGIIFGARLADHGVQLGEHDMAGTFIKTAIDCSLIAKMVGVPY